MLMLARRAQTRIGSGALVALAHIVFVLALVHYTGPRGDADSMPVDYITFAFIPVPTTTSAPEALGALPPPPIVMRSARPRRVAALREPQATPAPVPALAPGITLVQEAATDARAEAAPALAGALDMVSLRSAARQMEKERVPTALERLRTSEQMHARDDNKLSRAINEAKRPDCQTKYSGGTKLDLIRLIPLAIDTITDTGCKW